MSEPRPTFGPEILLLIGGLLLAAYTFLKSL